MLIRQRALLDYARPMRRVRPLGTNVVLVLAVALVLGLLTANPFADAVGFPSIDNARLQRGYVFIRVMCGVVTTFAAGVAVSLLLKGLAMLLSALWRTSARPAFPVVLTLLISGPLCMLAALALPLYLDQPGSTASHMSLLTELLSVLTFLAGCLLIGIGIWAGIRPSLHDAANKNGTGGSMSPAMFGVLQSHAHVSSEHGIGHGPVELHEVSGPRKAAI